MRIISGSHGGRRYSPPMKKWPTRPTTDIAKEALFNILQNRLDFEDLSMLDLFAGTATHTIEFISRGGRSATYVDRFIPAISFVKQLVSDYEMNDRIEIVKSDVFKYIKNADSSFDYIFADPPYSLNKIASMPDLIFDSSLMKSDTLLVIEHDQNNSFTTHPRFEDCRNYGQSFFSFFS